MIFRNVLGSLAGFSWLMLLELTLVDVVRAERLNDGLSVRVSELWERPNSSSFLEVGRSRCGFSASGRAVESGTSNLLGSGHPRKVIDSERWKKWGGGWDEAAQSSGNAACWGWGFGSD